MDSKVNYAFVGLFVIVLSIMLVASILWLSVGIENNNYETYQIYVQESVSGLNQKAHVKYRGVNVGYVRDISFKTDRAPDIRVLLDIEPGVPLKQDTFAVLSVQLVTGLAHVELTGGSPDAPKPVREKWQEYPELKTKPSLRARLDTGVFALLKNLNNVSESANKFLNNLDPKIADNLLANVSNLSRAVNGLLSEQNYLAVTNILHNIETVSGALAARTDSVDQALANILKTTEIINKISDSVITLLTQLEKSLASIENSSNAFAQTAKSITKTTDKVDNVVSSVGETTDLIGKTADRIRIAVDESRQDMNYFTRQALPEVTNSLRELQVLLNSLRNFAQELERKPNMLLFGKSEKPPGPGED
jgi:phospholipid/cholesterol/gamma-HCH transport system substrate-binding protein